MRDFLDFTKQLNFINLSRTVDADGKKNSWLQIHEFKFETGLFGFRFRYNLKDVYRNCLLGPKRTPKNQNPKPVFKQPPLLHPRGLKLKAPKVIDLKVLMQFVPLVYQGFYNDIFDTH